MNEIQETERFLVFENYQHTLSKNIINYLDREAFVNITLVCNGENIRAHQIILSACSPFFENILIDQKQPHPIVIFADITKSEMQILLQYMYVGRVSVPDSLVPSILKAAKKLQLRGLDHEKFDNLQSTFREDITDASSAPPNLSAILNEPDVHNTGAEPIEHNNNSPKTRPETNSDKWLSAAHNPDQQTDHGKKVLNPFAKKLSSSTDSDSTVFGNNKPVPGSSRNRRALSTDSDIEFVDINPVVVIPDSQYGDNSKLREPEKNRSTSTCSEFSEADDSELLPSNSKKPKIESSSTSAKVKVNPVALKKRSKDNLNHTSANVSKYFPSSNSHGAEDGIQKKSDKRGDLSRGKTNQHASDRLNKNQNKDAALPSNSKKKSNQKPNRKTTEPFEGFCQMSLKNLRKFCVVCQKKRKNIREHIKEKHCVPPRGKKFYCEGCSKMFSFKTSLIYHKCKQRQYC